MKRSLFLAAAAAALTVAAPAALQAHRMWLLPSITVVSGNDNWVTFDAAASTDVFAADHQPLRVEPTAIAPDGSAGKVENFATGRYRSTFDLHLTQQGTWAVELASGGVMGSYKVGAEEKRLPRGTTPDKIKELIPADATEVKLTEAANRYQVFVTAGAPTDTVLKPKGQGLEFVPVTHPNDLVDGEPAEFGFVVDGKPAAGLKVTLVKAGMRYRADPGEKSLTTDAAGKIKVAWDGPGMYWLNTTSMGKSSVVAGADKRLMYTTTLEVLPR